MDWLYFTQCLTSFSSINLLPYPLCTIFDSISSNIDEILLINPFANVFVFGDFNVHHKDQLTYSGGTDRSGKLCYNFSISNDLTQMVNFPTWIPDCDSDSPAFLDFFLSYDASICSTMSFPPLWNYDHCFASVSIYFSSCSKWDAPFHCIAYDYSCADWDGLIGKGLGWNWCMQPSNLSQHSAITKVFLLLRDIGIFCNTHLQIIAKEKLP